MIELDEKSYILGYWFASDGENDWYLIMTKNKDGWLGEYTFRYNKGDDDPFSGKDEKSKYTIKLPIDYPEKKVIEQINKLFQVIILKYSDNHDSFLVQGDLKKFMDIAKTKNYLHIKVGTHG